MGCFDRVGLTGNLLDVCHPAALERRRHANPIRCLELGRFAEPLRDALRDPALARTRTAGLEAEFIPRRNFRKEDRIAESLHRRGEHPGLVHVFSAMEPCPAFRAALEDRAGGSVILERLTEPTRDEQPRSYRGFDYCAAGELSVLLASLRGESQISGLSNRLLQQGLLEKNAGHLSRVLKRRRLDGLIKKIGRPYKYHLTALGSAPSSPRSNSRRISSFQPGCRRLQPRRYPSHLAPHFSVRD